MKLLILIFKESMIGKDYNRGLKYKIEFQVNLCGNFYEVN